MTGYDLLLHVGMPRSAAVLRPALGRLRPQLHRRGIAFVGNAMANKVPVAASDGAPVGEHFARHVAACVAEQAKKAAGPNSTVVVSSDQLLGPGDFGPQDSREFRPDATRVISQLAAAVPSRRLRIVLYTERQDRILEFAYAQRVRDGELITAEDFFAGTGHAFDYGDLVDRLASIDEVHDVIVRPGEFADRGALAFVDDFLGLVGAAGKLDLYAAGAALPSYPVVYSGQAVQLALAMTPLLDTPRERDLLRDYLSTGYSSGDYNMTDVMTRDQRAELLESYAAANRELFRKHMPTLRDDSYADDAATFALGNVLAQPRRSTALVPAGAVDGTEQLKRFGRRAVRSARRRASGLVRRFR